MKSLIVKTRDFVDDMLSVNVECSLGDLLLPGNRIDNGQVTVTSRYYDIVCYKDGTDSTFPFQNALSYVMWGKNHDWQTGNKNFTNLITSYDKNGYQKGSRIVLWKGKDIANGTHRIAMNFYHKIWDIEARVLPRNNRHNKGIEWYLERGLNPKWTEVLHDMREKMIEVLFDEGVTFGMWVEDVSENQYTELEKMMQSKTSQYRLIKLNGGGISSLLWLIPTTKSKREDFILEKHNEYIKRSAA